MAWWDHAICHHISHGATLLLFIISLSDLGIYKYPYLTGHFPPCSLLDFLSVLWACKTSDKLQCSNWSPASNPAAALTFSLYWLTSLSLQAGGMTWWGGSPPCHVTILFDVEKPAKSTTTMYANDILVRDYHHSIVVAASNDATHHNTPSLETSARHDKGGYSGYPRAMPSTMVGIQGTFAKFFFIYILFTDYNNSCHWRWQQLPTPMRVDPHHLKMRDGGHFFPSTSCFNLILQYILVYILN